MKDNKRRWLERGKSLLILLLSVSALYLMWQSPLIRNSGLMELFSDGRSGGDSGSTSVSLANAPIPARMAVGSEQGLYGVQYDQAAADALFDQAGPLLGEALSGAGEAAALSQSQWQARLTGRCVYFDFASQVPLTALCSWLTGETEHTNPDASARWVLLAAEEDGTISLCYGVEEGRFYRCATSLNADLHLAPIIESVTPNNAFFAFEDETMSEIVAPYTLFAGTEIQAVTYSSATPTILSDDAQAQTLLNALSFSSQNRAAVPEGVLYVDGDDTLRLSGSGRVVYDGSGQGKYTAGEGLNGAVDAAWALANAALGPLCGDARLHLLSAQEGEEGCYTVAFGYVLNGCSVYLYDQGWAAWFSIENGVIREFTLYLRTYTSVAQQTLLLPADKAAAALTALSDEPRELVIQYSDGGGSTVLPGWVGR